MTVMALGNTSISRILTLGLGTLPLYNISHPLQTPVYKGRPLR